MRPLVSAVIPTHNRADLLREALDSVFAQQGAGELFDLDVIVVDDASSDHTVGVVSGYPTARCIRLDQNRGLSGARNAGLEGTRGSYVAFLDDDDLWLPHKLKLQVAALERNPTAGVAYSQYYVQRRGGKPVLTPEAASAPSGWVLPAMLTGPWSFSMLNLLVRREAFERAGRFDEHVDFVEDRDMLFRLAFHVPFVFIPGAVFVYRQTGGGLSGINGARRGDALRPVLEKVLALLPDTDENARIKKVARARLGLSFVPQLASSGDLDQARALIVDWLRVMPRAERDGLAQTAISSVARAIGRTTPRPIEALERFCVEITVTSAHNGRRSLAAVRRVLAGVWREGAISLSLTATRPPGVVARAAARAAVLDPVGAASGELVKALGRSLLRTSDATRSH